MINLWVVYLVFFCLSLILCFFIFILSINGFYVNVLGVDYLQRDIMKQGKNKVVSLIYRVLNDYMDSDCFN